MNSQRNRMEVTIMLTAAAVLDLVCLNIISLVGNVKLCTGPLGFRFHTCDSCFRFKL